VRIHKQVKVVAKKSGPVSGRFRVRPLKIILCNRDPCSTETTLVENGVKIKLDPAKVYYSVRLSTERKRIYERVADGERILVMFAGVGPFALIIAKHRQVDVAAVEWNPDAVYYLKENIRINRLKGKVVPVLGDVREVVPQRFRHWADRVIMPLPKSADDFLDLAVLALRGNGHVHTYTFLNEDVWKDELSRWLEQRCSELCDRFNVELNVYESHVVRPYAPHVVQVSVDLFVKRIKGS